VFKPYILSKFLFFHIVFKKVKPKVPVKATQAWNPVFFHGYVIWW